MSYGAGSVQFQVNKNNATRGIYFQREKPKTDSRKFGYKSKSLRHPIRQPDNEEELERLQKAAEEEKRKFNKKNVDFIRQNRERYQPKENETGPPPGTTHIAPGTVTLTQDQLAALLKTLGKTSQAVGDNSLKISIDAENNKIEVEQYEGDSNGDRDSDAGDNRIRASTNYNQYNDGGDNDDNASEVGIEALLNGDTKESKPKNKRTGDSREKQREQASLRSKEGRKQKEREDQKEVESIPQPSYSTGNLQKPEMAQRSGGGGGALPQTRLSLEDAKKMAGVSHVPDIVPWRHLTVGEKKRLQWARERAEVAEDYNPWGKPGAGAPSQKQPEEERQPASRATDWISKEPPTAHDRPSTTQRKKNQDDESQLSKKELERRKWLAELDKQREEQRLKKQQEKERDRAGLQDHWADRFVYNKTINQISPRAAQAGVTRDSYEGSGAGRPMDRTRHGQGSVLGRAAPPQDEVDSAPPAAMRSSMVVGDGSLNEGRYNNTKAEEKRKWLQELEKQREEQRLAKQAQKERDRQDSYNGTWADHYPSDHQKLLHTMPHHHGRHPQGHQQQQLPLESASVANMTSAAGTFQPMAGGNSPRIADLTGADAQRTSSAPQSVTKSAAPEDSSTFLRGQGVFVDPVTRREQEEKRRVHLEYQAEIKAQIEEKERQKREERERKRREDIEEERKLQMEREQFNKQAEMEQHKLREKEEQRQRQITALKSAMDAAQERAIEEKTHRRLNHLEQHGHDVSQLKATYDEPPHLPAHGYDNGLHQATPRTKQYNASTIPGLEIDAGIQNHRASPPIQDLVDYARFEPPRQAAQVQPRYPLGQSYTKEPYVEDRVLTPSRFRDPGRPRDLPDSPSREFGTQTLELKELQNILNSLPEDIQIEYKLKVEDALREKEGRANRQQKQQQQPPHRKVHIKSAEGADKRRGAVGKPPQAGGKASALTSGKGRMLEKPTEKGASQKKLAWNQKQRKTVVKNSERDPFYEQKKEQAELRRARREKQLQYLQELNSQNIPTQHASRSKSRHEHCSPRRDDQDNQGHDRHRSQSPNILSLNNSNAEERGRGRSIGGRSSRHSGKSKSPTSRHPLSTGRSSPPIPAIRHRAAAVRDANPERDPYVHANRQLKDSQSDTRYGDAAFLPISDGEFVPFMRTTEILDPARAEEPMAMSRENSRMERARRAYRETHNPADKGRKVEIYQDREREAALKAQAQASQNPLLNPSLVTDHPTGRQDMILQQLSSLKQTLMQRQKELETYMSPAELEMEATRT